MEGIKHTLECQCILPQFKNRSNPIFHKFIVFSVIDDDKVKSTYAQCNNCGIVHKIVDLCKSEILVGREDIKSIPTVEDIKLSLPEQLSHVLEVYDCDLPQWQHAQFIYFAKQWGSYIVLVREELDDETQGKMLKIKNFDHFIIEPFVDSY